MRIKGDVDEIRFRNEDNGFTIAVMDVDGDPVIATGVFPPVVEGQTLELDGAWVVHKKYGRQFKVERCVLSVPRGADGIVRYLGSGLIKGIGPVLALRIVSHFGERTFEVIEKTPLRLAEVKGITSAKAGEIAAAYGAIKEMQDAVMTLQSYDIPLGTAMKIYRTYGKDTAETVSANPYRLIEDVDGVGFITADRIAAKAGIGKTSAFRIGAGLVYTLKERVGKNGDTCYPKEKTIAEAAKILGVDSGLVADELEDMIERYRTFGRRGRRIAGGLQKRKERRGIARQAYRFGGSHGFRRRRGYRQIRKTKRYKTSFVSAASGCGRGKKRSYARHRRSGNGQDYHYQVRYRRF